jgi:D-arabinose 1-dehydrogenase-like Zn-dependent alcohol dehydrogenase
MLAYRLKKPGIAAFEDVPRPQAAPGEIVVAIQVNGLCRSDLHALRGTLKQHSSTLGHEGAGIVDSLGAGVDGLRVGDRVVINYVNPDGTCPMCRHGREDLCQRPPLGFGTDGMFAEAIAVPAGNVALLPPEVPSEEGAVLGCAGSTALAATMHSGLRPGMSCMVVGVGGVGMQGIQVAKLFGASPLIAVDIRETKLRLAERLGADIVVDATLEDPVKVARSLGDRRGVDVAFEYIGLAKTLNQALEATRWGGRTVMVGIPAGEITFDAQAFNIGGKTLVASQGHTNQDLREAINLRARGFLRTGETITHRMPFPDLEKAISMLENQEGDPVRITLHH